MSAGMETVRERMAEYLREQGIDAKTAWPDQTGPEDESPIVVVSLRSCEVGPTGFWDYLGERYNEETGLWEELYGKRAELIFGLDLYADKMSGGEGLQAAFDALAGALARGGPDGLTIRSFSSEESGYDRQARRMKRTVQAVCTVCLYAAGQPEDTFVDFEVRGGMRA